MKKPLITIIVPVYNVEQYIDRCVESLIKQTYSNLEILLIDDGSPDNCPAICDEWRKKDNRIQAFHKLNGGLSDARNYGTKHAKGEYITFVDSDDCVADNYVEYLYNLIKQTGATISCCFYEKFTNNIQFPNQDDEKVYVVSGEDACYKMYYNVQLVIACGKLFKKEIVQKNLFPYGRLHEDEATLYKMLYFENNIAVSNLKLYGYYQNDCGITHNYNKKNDEDLLKTYKERIDFYANRESWKLYSISYHAFVCQKLRALEKPTRNEAVNLLKECIGNRKVLIKTKLKILYYILLKKLPSWMK